MSALAALALTAEHCGKLAGPDIAAERIEMPVAACRVRGMLHPVRGSNIGFELWLPDAWNGRYYQIGTGGFAGTIFPDSLAWDAAKGNAVAMTDSGHRGLPTEAGWARGNRVGVVDYGWRSIKATSDAAARLIVRYYGHAARARYFAGCSNGGRQALVAAQRFAQDWDGIIAGAPANLWTTQLRSFAGLQAQIARDPAALRPDRLARVQADALAKCPRGSVVASVALDPRQCRYRPTEPLIAAIVAAGYEPTATGEWARWMSPGAPAPSHASFAKGGRILLAQAGARDLDASAVDFSAFSKRGGRLIVYFGTADPVIAPRRFLGWHTRVVAADPRAANWYRLFMVPGMSHCQGGDVPDSFGQSPASLPSPGGDIRASIEAWVEHGVAPKRLVATQREGGQVVATRVLTPLD